ncbi:MAG: chemotaxis protein CheW [Spirulinaceae cyanobacterium]
MQNNCWNQIGVWGDRTCATLTNVTHCQNCSVYSQSGRALLDRPPAEGYGSEWTEQLAKPRQQRQVGGRGETITLSIFRLGCEWLALPAGLIDQALNPSPVHSLPHRSDRILRGIVNVRGQLWLCVSLHELLGIATTETQTTDRTPGCYPRLVVIQRQQETWAFETNELYGLHRCSRLDLHNAPTDRSQRLDSFTESILPWQSGNVSILNADLLFEALRQKTL